MNGKKTSEDEPSIEALDEPVITSYYGSEEATRELDEILKQSSQSIIDPPVGAHSAREDIRAWLDDLRRREQTGEVQLAIQQAEAWLQEKLK